MVLGIRYNRRRLQGVNQHLLHFTFTNAGNDIPIDQRFDQMASEIRRRIRGHFERDLDAQHPYLLNFAPAEDRVGGSRQFPLQRASSITGQFLRQIYDGMLHSQETIGIEGFKVKKIKKIKKKID